MYILLNYLIGVGPLFGRVGRGAQEAVLSGCRLPLCFGFLAIGYRLKAK